MDVLFWIFLFGGGALLAPLVDAIAHRIRGDKLSKRTLSQMLSDPALVELIAVKLKEREQATKENDRLLEEAAMRLLSDEEFAARVFDRKLAEQK